MIPAMSMTLPFRSINLSAPVNILLGKNDHVPKLPNPKIHQKHHNAAHDKRLPPLVRNTSSHTARKKKSDTEKSNKKGKKDTAAISHSRMRKANVYSASPEYDEEDEEELIMEQRKLLEVVEGEEEEEEAEQKADSGFYGEELYLSNNMFKLPPITMSAEKLLKKKQAEYRHRRDEKRKEKDMRANWKGPFTLPPAPRIEKVVTPSLAELRHETIALPDKVPTFEEFLKLLKDDEYYDPRYKNKVRMKTKKIAQRYYIANGLHRTSVIFSFTNIPEAIRLGKKESGLLAEGRKSHNSTTRVSALSTEEQPRHSHSELPSVSEGRTTDCGNLPTTRSRGSVEVLGITDSKPCKDHFYKEATDFKHSKKSRRKHRGNDLVGGLSLIDESSSSSRNSVDPNKLGRLPRVRVTTQEPTPSPKGRRTTSSGRRSGPRFPKYAFLDSDSEESESSVEQEESEIESPTMFNVDKLNIRYSIERIKKRKKAKPKKKPAFMDVLSKYYKMQNMITLLSKPKKPPVKKSVIGAKILGKLRRKFGLFTSYL